MTVARLALLLAALPTTAYSQASPAACRGTFAVGNEEQFVACARAGTEKYRDRRVAILDGYRRIGRDFPAMGEHWIRVSLVFDGTFDAAKPELLNYIIIDGAPHLVGVAYAVPLLAGESPPTAPAGPGAWHEHSRSIDEETLLPRHMHGETSTGSRLSMLHAWIWSPNPDGMFAADNWAIPFLRVQVAPTADVTPAMGKALALATGGREYFEMVIDAGAGLSATDKKQSSSALDKAQREVEAIVGDLKQHGGNGLATRRLAQVWTQLWANIEAAVSNEARRRLALLPIR